MSEQLTNNERALLRVLEDGLRLQFHRGVYVATSETKGEILDAFPVMLVTIAEQMGWIFYNTHRVWVLTDKGREMLEATG